MNAPEAPFALADIQSNTDQRGLTINEVGVAGLRYPITVHSKERSVQHCVGTFDMSVTLQPEVKGTHMSRFVEILESHTAPISVTNSLALLEAMLARLDATAGRLQVGFAYFVRKIAPVSSVASLLDYDVMINAERSETGRSTTTLRVVVPVTSLCPCSKAISSYGAHNQRSHVTVEVRVLDQTLTIDELITVVEQEASCELYGLLKRTDEKYVTERAYDNPKFAEDLVRDVAKHLIADPRIGDFSVEAENFESIHNHSARALIKQKKYVGGSGSEYAI